MYEKRDKIARTVAETNGVIKFVGEDIQHIQNTDFV
jgi:hypothetical protein